MFSALCPTFSLSLLTCMVWSWLLDGVDGSTNTIRRAAAIQVGHLANDRPHDDVLLILEKVVSSFVRLETHNTTDDVAFP